MALQSAASSGHNAALSALGQRLCEARLEAHIKTKSLKTAAPRCFRTMQARHSSSLSFARFLLLPRLPVLLRLQALARACLRRPGRFKRLGGNHAGCKAARDVAFNTARSTLPQVEVEIANLEVGTWLALEALQWHVVSVQEGLHSMGGGVSAEPVVMHAAQARQSPFA